MLHVDSISYSSMLLTTTPLLYWLYSLACFMGIVVAEKFSTLSCASQMAD